MSLDHVLRLWPSGNCEPLSLILRIVTSCSSCGLWLLSYNQVTPLSADRDSPGGSVNHASTAQLRRSLWESPGSQAEFWMNWEASHAAPLFAWVGSMAGHDRSRLSGSSLSFAVIFSAYNSNTESGAWSATLEILSMGR